MDLWTYLASASKNIVIYGMGNGADKIIGVCDSYGIVISDFFASDGFVRGQIFHDKKVMSFSEIKEKYGKDFVELINTFIKLAILLDYDSYLCYNLYSYSNYQL